MLELIVKQRVAAFPKFKKPFKLHLKEVLASLAFLNL